LDPGGSDLRSLVRVNLARPSLVRRVRRKERRTGRLGKRTTGRLAPRRGLRRGRAGATGRRDGRLGLSQAEASRVEAGRAASLLAIDRPRAAAFQPSRHGRSRSTRNGRSIIGRPSRNRRRRHGVPRRSRSRTWRRGSRSSCTLSRCRISGGASGLNRSGLDRTGQDRSVPVRADLRLAGRPGLGQAQAGPMQDVQARRALSAARAGWLGLLPPAAASPGLEALVQAASPAVPLEDRMVLVRGVVVPVQVRMRGPALAQSGRLTAKAGRPARRSGLTRRAEKALKDSGRAARAHGQSAEPAPAGSPSRASIERARAARALPGIGSGPKQAPGQGRADFRSRVTRGSRADLEPNGAVHALGAKSLEADGLSCGEKALRRACETRTAGIP